MEILEPPMSSDIIVGEDELGAFARIQLDASVYGETALYKTAYWFTDRYYIYLQRDPVQRDWISTEIRRKTNNSHEPGLDVIVREFVNHLLDQKVRQEVLTETGSLRELLLRKAFFEGGKAKVPPTLASDESHVPENKAGLSCSTMGVERLSE